jgi:threonine dehydrogenase-like Zn-dependent dehydrogenase
VGQFAIASAFQMGAGRVIAVDRLQDRLDSARSLGADVLNFDAEDPVEAIMAPTGGIGVDRVIDAVGVDAQHRTAAQPFRQTRRNKRSPRAARLRRSGTRTA